MCAFPEIVTYEAATIVFGPGNKRETAICLLLRCLAGHSPLDTPKPIAFFKKVKNVTKWVAVARKSAKNDAFETICRNTAHGDAHFGQNPMFFLFDF